MLLAVSCGGGADDGPSDGTSDTAAPTETAAPAETDGTAAPDESGDSGSGSMSASLTIDGETYEFSETGFAAETCDPSFFGGFWAALYMPDGAGGVMSGTSATILLIPEELEDDLEQVSAIAVSVDSAAVDYHADPELEGRGGGLSSVDSFTIDGNSATGSATFVNRDTPFDEDIVPVEGTFEVACG